MKTRVATSKSRRDSMKAGEEGEEIDDFFGLKSPIFCWDEPFPIPPRAFPAPAKFSSTKSKRTPNHPPHHEPKHKSVQISAPSPSVLHQ